MNAMLIVAHGSRKQGSNDEIRALTADVAARVDGQFDVIDCAFLELADPSIPQGIEQLIARGATSIQVVPYFLARGTHVATDIPHEVDSVRSQHPEVDIVVTDYFGKSALIPDVLVQVALGAKTSGAA